MRQLGILAVLAIAMSATVAHAKIGYEGQFLQANGTPVAGPIDVKVQVRSPGAENCVLFEETRTLTAAADGYFSLALNDGAGTRTDTSGIGFEAVFSNRVAMTGLTGLCSVGTSYTPVSTDGRRFVVSARVSGAGTWEDFPPIAVNAVPVALQAQEVGGFGVGALLRAVDGSGNPQNISPLSNANYTELMALLGGTSSQYVKAGASTGSMVTTVAGNVGSPSAGSIWFDTASSTMKYYNGSSVVAIGSGGAAGGATSVAAMPGSAAAPSISFSANLNSGFYSGASGSIQASVGGVDQMAVTSTGVGIGTTAPLTKLDVVGSIRIGDGGETCVAGVAGGVRYNGGNIQFCNGSSWTTLGTAGAGITALTGDVTAAGAGSVAGTVAFVGGQSAVTIASGTVLSMAATSVNTGSAIVRRDPSGNFTSNIATLNGVALNNAGSILNLTNPIGAAYNLSLPTGLGTNGQVLTTDGAGASSWTSVVTPSTGFVNGGSSMGGAATVGTNDAYALNLETNNVTRMTILNSGKVGVGTGAPNATLDVQAIAGTTAFPVASVKALAGHTVDVFQVLDSAGAEVFGVDKLGNTMASQYRSGNGSAGGPAFTPNSDTLTGVYFPATSVIGLSTAGSERMRVDPSGNVGIGTTSPATLLDVVTTTSGAVVSRVKNLSSAAGAKAQLTAEDAGQTISMGMLGPSTSVTGIPTGSSFIDSVASITLRAMSADGGIRFITGPSPTSERMRISANGNVGIGAAASNPTSPLTVGGGNPSGNGVVAEIMSNSIYASGTAFDQKSLYINNSTGTGGYTQTGAVSGISSTVTANGGGSQQYLYSMYSDFGIQTGTTTIANAYGVYMHPTTASGSTITNLYGLYLDNVFGPGTVTNRFGVYQADSSARNHFNGAVGIGTTTPRSRLDVAGAIISAPTNSGIAGTTIDFLQGNVMYSTNTGAQTYALYNLKDGGTYTFIVKGSGAGSVTLNCYSDAGTTGLTTHSTVSSITKSVSKFLIVYLTVVGSDVVVDVKNEF